MRLIPLLQKIFPALAVTILLGLSYPAASARAEDDLLDHTRMFGSPNLGITEIEDLPPELINEVMGYLTFQSLTNFMQTNRLYFELGKNQPIWKSACLQRARKKVRSLLAPRYFTDASGYGYGPSYRDSLSGSERDKLDSIISRIPTHTQEEILGILSWRELLITMKKLASSPQDFERVRSHERVKRTSILSIQASIQAASSSLGTAARESIGSTTLHLLCTSGALIWGCGALFVTAANLAVDPKFAVLSLLSAPLSILAGAAGLATAPVAPLVYTYQALSHVPENYQLEVIEQKRTTDEREYQEFLNATWDDLETRFGVNPIPGILFIEGPDFTPRQSQDH